MSGANPCVSVSGTPGRSLPGRIKAERGSGQTGKRKLSTSKKRRMQHGTALLLSYVAVWFQIQACGVGCLLFLDSLSQYFFPPLHFWFSGLSRDKKGMFVHWQKGLFQPCEMYGCLAASRVSALLSITQPRASSPPPWLEPWRRVCVWGREDSAYLSRIAFLSFPEIAITWLKPGTRDSTDLLSCSLQISLTLPVDLSCWVWLLPFPLNSTHKPCFCQAASACSFTCCLPAHRNGARGTPCRARRIFQRSPGWNLRWATGKTEMVFAANAATTWQLFPNLHLIHSPGLRYSEEQELHSIFVLGPKRWSLAPEGGKTRIGVSYPELSPVSVWIKSRNWVGVSLPAHWKTQASALPAVLNFSTESFTGVITFDL